jgi:acetyl-CoA carboxylase biotin carboxyl carrier protein
MIRNGFRTRAKVPKASHDGSTMPTPIDADLLRQLAQLISDSDLAEMVIEKGDLRIKMVRQTHNGGGGTFVTSPVVVAAQPTVPGPSSMLPGAAGTTGPSIAEDHPGSVKSPMVGTVYRRANPEAKAFVEIGSSVKVGDKLLLIEAMKTFNDIVAPRSGTVAALFIEDGQPVEYGQPLLVIE